MTTEPNQSALPRISANFGGVSKREYFAVMAMQGLLAGTDLTNPAAGESIQKAMNIAGVKTFDALVALNACNIADALIAALNEKK